jgi:pimeloyl-ACP methyl ester carboxylesterase
VLVHGVPETAAVWNPLRSVLTRTDLVPIELPGFGCPRPDGFGATKEEYVDWLVDLLELLASEGPVDLVGHDWGGGLTVRLVSIRPDLVRSWVTDAARYGDPDFEWHEFAKVWQTPGAGEQFWDGVLAQGLDERAALFASFGVPPDPARVLAAGIDRTMAECILPLYRSALELGRQWAPDFTDVPAPGLVLMPTDDPFLRPDEAHAATTRSGARVVQLKGLGHWWMLQDPTAAASALEEFWASLA